MKFLGTLLFSFLFVTIINSNQALAQAGFEVIDGPQEVTEPSGMDILEVEALVVEAHQDILGRAPKSHYGFEYWKQQILSGNLSEAQFIEALANSPEGMINGFYQYYLGRNADDAGRAHWLRKHRQGVSLDRIERAISSSPEAQSR